MNRFAILCIGYILGLGAAVLMDTLGEAKLINLKQEDWRCVEYLPNSADCAVYERVGRPRE